MRHFLMWFRAYVNYAYKKMMKLDVNFTADQNLNFDRKINYETTNMFKICS